MKLRFLVPLILLLLTNCEKKDATEKSLLNYVPENASVIIKITDHETFKNALKDNTFLSNLSTSKLYQELHHKVSYLNYVQPKSESILAFTEIGANNFEFTYITKNTTNLFLLDSVKNKTVKTIEFANSTFEKYEVDESIFYALESNGNIILSSSELILEKLNGKLAPTPSAILKKLYASVNNTKSASIFINLNRSNSLIAASLNDKSDLNISGFSDWISLDLQASEKNLRFTGVSIANDSIRNYVDLFANTKPVANSTILFAPASADAILSYTFDNYSAFAKNRELSTGVISPSTPTLNTVEEIGIIYLKNKKAILMNTYGAETIAEYLRSEKKGVIEFLGHEIIELQKPEFLNSRFSPLVKDFKSRFCTILKDAFVFTENQATLKAILTNYKDGRTFHKAAIYETLKDDIALESSILFLANGKRINSIFDNNFSANLARDIYKLPLSNYGFAAQTIVDKSLYHINVVIQEINKTSQKANISALFDIELDSDVATNPQFVTNHITKKKEIVVQDTKNVLYLISGKGKILWKKQLESLVQGKIHQVDIFKNGRLQLAFTTNNQMMVLDRNGKEVKQFTKTFEGGNLNPLAVFDYAKKKNYRFIVTQNDKVYMYDSKATIVKGFKFTKATQPIIAAPKHLVIQNKDYLVFKLKDGTLKLLNRVGDIRTKVNEKIDFSENEVFIYKNRFTLTDKKGMLYEIDDKGKIKKTSLKLSNDHGMYSTEQTLVTMNDNMLNIKGKRIELEMGVYTQPKIFYIYNKIYVSVTDLQNEKIYLFDSQANSIAGFPVSGASSIDLQNIDNDKSLEIVSKKNSTSLITYKIN